MRFARKGRIRSAISLVLSAAMVASLVVMPAFAEPVASVASLMDGGTTGVTSVTGTDTAGYNGVYQVDIDAITGKSAFENKGVSSADTTLGAAFSVTDSLAATVTAWLPNGLSEIATSTLTSETPVSGVVAWVDSMANLTAAISAEGTATIEHVLPGAFDIDFDDEGAAVLSGIFGTQDVWGESGLEPSSGFGSYTATFTPDGGNALQVAMDAVGVVEDGAVVSKVDTATGLYTALLFDNGFLAVAPGGLKDGTLTVGAGQGVRNPVSGSVMGFSQGGNEPENWQAGIVETLTIDYYAAEGDFNAINGITLALPDGFAVSGPASIEGVSASQTVDPVTGVLTIDKFVAYETGIVINVPVTNATEVKNADAVAEDAYLYGQAVVKSRNVGGSAFTTETVQPLRVLPNKNARATGFNPERINAGGKTLIEGVVKDTYGNVDSYWEHSLQFAIAAPSADATMTDIAFDRRMGIGWSAERSQIDTTTFSEGKFSIWLQTATTSGVNTVTVTADQTGANPKAFVVDTAGIGDPYKLEVFTTTGTWSFAETDTATLGLRVVDSAGNPTSFDQDMWFDATGDVGSWIAWWYGNPAFYVPAGLSKSVNTVDVPGGWFDNTTGDDSATVSASDPLGYVFPADFDTLTFLETEDMESIYRVLIKPDVEHRVADWSTEDGFWRYFVTNGYGDTPDSFGFARANGTDEITYTGQLVDQLDRPIELAGQTVTITVGCYDSYSSNPWPGKVNTKTAVTDASGSFTFTAKSTTGSQWTHFEDDPMYDEVHDRTRYPDHDHSYFTPIGVDVTCTAAYRGYDTEYDGYTFAYFSAPEIVDSRTNPYSAKADGIDAVTYNVAYQWSMIDEPAEGVDVSFTNYDYPGTLSAATGVTNAEGIATVDVTSTEPGYGRVYSYDQAGDYTSSEYMFGSYSLEVELLNPISGDNTYRAGEDTYVDMKVTIVDADGNPVIFETEAYRDGYGWDYPDLYPSGEWKNLGWNGWELLTTELNDRQVATGFSVRVYPSRGGMTVADLGAFVGNASGMLTARDIRTVDGLRSRWVEPVDVGFDMNFVNQASASCDAFVDSYDYFDLTGAGFFSPGPNVTRYVDVYINVNGEWLYNDYTDVRLDGQGEILESRIRVKQFWGRNERGDWAYYSIPAGTHDLMIDGVVIPDALVVAAGRPEYDLTVSGIAEGQVFAPGTVPTSLFVAGEIDDPLYWCEIWVDGVNLGDSNENPGESTVFTGLNMSFVKPGRHTLLVEWESNDNWGMKEITFFVKAPATLTAAAPASAPAYNTAYVVSGKLAATGASVANQTITIERSANGTNWSAFKTATTNSTGGYSFTAQSTATTYFRIKFAGSDGAKSATAYATVKPKAVLNKPVVGLTQTAGKTFSFHSVLTPKHTAGAKSVSIYVYKWNGAKWAYVKQVAAVNYSLTSATKAVGKTSLAEGTYRLRARHADGSHAITWSVYSNTFKVK